MVTRLGSALNETLIGSSGNDYLSGGRGSDVIRGLDGADLLFGGDGDDSVFGGPGDDILIEAVIGSQNVVGWGSDLLNGGAGFDTVAYDVGEVRPAGPLNADLRLGVVRGRDPVSNEVYIDRLVNIEAFVASNLADRVIVGGDWFVETGEGDDRVVWRSGAAELYGGSPGRGEFRDNDVLDLSAATGAVTLAVDGTITVAGAPDFSASGFESIIGSMVAPNTVVRPQSALNIENLTLIGGNAADTLIGGQSGRVLKGFDGDDVLRSGDGSATIDAGDGNDDVTLTNSFFRRRTAEVDLGTGDDRFVGQSTRGHIDAGEGDDIIVLRDTGFTVTGGVGDDVFAVASSFAIIFGGEGTDNLVLQTLPGFNSVSNVNTEGVEVIVGSEVRGDRVIAQGADRILGRGGPDDITSRGGGTTVYGGDGNDEVLAASGDLVFGGDGNDRFTSRGLGTFFGDAGNDTLVISNINEAREGYTFFGGDGADTLSRSRGLFEGRSESMAFGGADNDRLEGIAAGLGTATMFGGSGDDLVSFAGTGEARGGDGRDRVFVEAGAVGYGGAGGDRVVAETGAFGYGGEGNDILAGSGILYGGSGSDVVRPDDGAEATLGAGRDVLGIEIKRGFGMSEYDVLDFDPTQDLLSTDDGRFSDYGVLTLNDLDRIYQSGDNVVIVVISRRETENFSGTRLELLNTDLSDLSDSILL
ncbi:MAG: calcium-binding protein [Pseudomonadota bacterium]